MWNQSMNESSRDRWGSKGTTDLHSGHLVHKTHGVFISSKSIYFIPNGLWRIVTAALLLHFHWLSALTLNLHCKEVTVLQQRCQNIGIKAVCQTPTQLHVPRVVLVLSLAVSLWRANFSWQQPGLCAGSHGNLLTNNSIRCKPIIVLGASLSDRRSSLGGLSPCYLDILFTLSSYMHIFQEASTIIGFPSNGPPVFPIIPPLSPSLLPLPS